jgi:hypothetical protein
LTSTYEVNRKERKREREREKKKERRERENKEIGSTTMCLN